MIINKIKFTIYSVLFCLILLYPIYSIAQNIIKTKKILDPGLITEPSGFPTIGKWMLNENFEPADWLKIKYKGKLMQEPINIIIIDSVSNSSEEAINNLLKNCTIAGFTGHGGHSAEYMGYIDGNFYKRLPYGVGKAFSDSKFNLNNNHGRIFGPCFIFDKYYFIGAFSREDFIKNEHLYDSFIIAREKFAQKMNDKTSYHIEKRINLNNKISDDLLLTTGDHDGQAIVLHCGE
jgi:hypothetical protein